MFTGMTIDLNNQLKLAPAGGASLLGRLSALAGRGGIARGKDMRYELQQERGTWYVWEVTDCGSTLVANFRREQAARDYLAAIENEARTLGLEVETAK